MCLRRALLLSALLAPAVVADVTYFRESSSPSSSPPASPVTGRLEEHQSGVGGLCDAEVVQRSGYFHVDAPNKTNEHYFYWMFESRVAPAAEQPFVLWLTGGPGCSGMLALLAENGPCKIEGGADGSLTPVNNTHSWTNAANVLWLDQPTGVGFSYGDAGDYDHDEAGVRDDVYHFLLAFFEAHPQYAKSDFFVFGESYGGHYAPNVAYRIWQGNGAHDEAKRAMAAGAAGAADAIAAPSLKINLAGVAVGNGLTDPAAQYPLYPAMAMNNTYGVKAVSEADYVAMQAELPACVAQIHACNAGGRSGSDKQACIEAQGACNNAQIGPYEEAGLNPYDVRIKCEIPGLCYNFSAPTQWLQQPAVRAALGVTSASAAWATCNMGVNQAFAADWMASQAYTVPPLLAAGVDVLVYAGDADFICNWMGNKAWARALDWPGKAGFDGAADHDWKVAGVKAGTARTAASGGSLTFLQVNDGGHMVPMDQPANSLQMVKTFTTGGSF